MLVKSCNFKKNIDKTSYRHDQISLNVLGSEDELVELRDKTFSKGKVVSKVALKGFFKHFEKDASSITTDFIITSAVIFDSELILNLQKERAPLNLNLGELLK
mgnify:CR=1 FL=1